MVALLACFLDLKGLFRVCAGLRPGRADGIAPASLTRQLCACLPRKPALHKADQSSTTSQKLSTWLLALTSRSFESVQQWLKAGPYLSPLHSNARVGARNRPDPLSCRCSQVTTRCGAHCISLSTSDVSFADLVPHSLNSIYEGVKNLM
jgi:hypothetical protein